MTRLLSTFSAAACIAVLLTACGGGGSSTSTPATPPAGNTQPEPPAQAEPTGALHAEAVAGRPDQPPRYANGPLATAQFNLSAYGSSQLAIDNNGNLFVFDDNAVVRKITPGGQVSLLAGSVGKPGSADGTGASASFMRIKGMVADASGNVYVASDTAIRKVSPAGVVTTLAGKQGPNSMMQDGLGAQASFYYINGLAIDATGNLYVAESALRRVSPSGQVDTVKLDSPPTSIVAVAVAPDGSLMVSDGEHLLRYDTSGKLLQTIGQPDGTVTINGKPDHFGRIMSFAFAPDGLLYVIDQFAFSNAIHTVDPAGNVVTLHSGLEDAGLVNGPIATARFGAGLILGNGIVADKAGNVYLLENGYYAIRKISADRQVSTFAGGWFAPPAFADGTGAAAAFHGIAGFVADQAGNFYVADQGNCAIRKITPGHVVTTLAGSGGQCGEADGTGAAARFQDIVAITQDAGGNLYVAEKTTVRKVTPAGVVTTVAGTIGTYTKVDGTGAAASFQNLLGIAVGPDGNLLVSDGHQGAGFPLCFFDVDNSPNSLRTITPQGVVSTVPGSEFSCADRDKATALWAAKDLAFDGSGNLYLASGGYLARRAPDGTAAYLLDSQGNKVAADKLAPDDAGNVFFTLGGSVYKYGADRVLAQVMAPTGMGNPFEITPDLPVRSISALAYIGNHKFLASFDSQVVVLTLK